MKFIIITIYTTVNDGAFMHKNRLSVKTASNGWDVITIEKGKQDLDCII